MHRVVIVSKNHSVLGIHWYKKKFLYSQSLCFSEKKEEIHTLCQVVKKKVL